MHGCGGGGTLTGLHPGGGGARSGVTQCTSPLGCGMQGCGRGGVTAANTSAGGALSNATQCAPPLSCGMQGGLGCTSEAGAGVGGINSAFHVTSPNPVRAAVSTAWHAPTQQAPQQLAPQQMGQPPGPMGHAPIQPPSIAQPQQQDNYAPAACRPQLPNNQPQSPGGAPHPAPAAIPSSPMAPQDSPPSSGLPPQTYPPSSPSHLPPAFLSSPALPPQAGPPSSPNHQPPAYPLSPELQPQTNPPSSQEQKQPAQDESSAPF
jgi:hypothetical protein